MPLRLVWKKWGRGISAGHMGSGVARVNAMSGRTCPLQSNSVLGIWELVIQCVGAKEVGLYRL